jgi:hypothetical protein
MRRPEVRGSNDLTPNYQRGTLGIYVFPRIHSPEAGRAICVASEGIRLSESYTIVAGSTGKVLKGAVPGDASPVDGRV